jgi:hypothetical protein
MRFAHTAIFVSDEHADSIACGGIPYATEQGTFKCVSGKVFQGTGNFNPSYERRSEPGALKHPMSNDGAGIEGDVLHACEGVLRDRQLALHRSQSDMQRRHDLRALSDGRSDTLD